LKVLICLAVAVTAIPAGAQVARSAGPAAPAPATVSLSIPGIAPGPDAAELRRRVAQLSARARSHARRLGLAPARRPAALPADPELLARREMRLARVVGFLSRSRELRVPVDVRAVPGRGPRGGDLASRLRREYLRASRLAVGLGVTRPAGLRIPATRAEMVREAARWRGIATWLGARSERIRPHERPLRARVPHYDALMCIAGHESGATWDIATGSGYYGGLQMDRLFQQTYAPRLYRAKGTADRWTAEQQMLAAERAIAVRGFTPWPHTARMCGLLQ